MPEEFKWHQGVELIDGKWEFAHARALFHWWTHFKEYNKMANGGPNNDDVQEDRNALAAEKNALAKENAELKAKLERVKALYDPMGVIWDGI
jgi:predicted nuclease with TOPRIM domain